jgi:hypothetical protein
MAKVSPAKAAPSTWIQNGRKYWRLITDDAEIVASMPEAYTPYCPPMHAKYEIYSIKKGLAMFHGYLEGEQLARAHLCFQQAFSR